MRMDEFDYDLPADRIADRPLLNRSDSRLMVVDRKTGGILHRTFRDLSEFLLPGDFLVLNDSRVIPARLWGTKRDGGAGIEILLLERIANMEWECIAQRAIRLREGTVVDFGEGNSCEVVAVLPAGRFVFRFATQLPWETFLDQYGEIPLPPYIHRRREELTETQRIELAVMDRERYQTTYAAPPGSAAAPTAGLHFDLPILDRLRAMGVDIGYVTLHVGLDTFSPVTVDRVEDHRMKGEWCQCPPETAERIRRVKESGEGRVIGVGTTVCRTLETYSRAGWPDGPLKSELFLKPGDNFQALDLLLTNFHLPKSTLLLLVSAFLGDGLRKRAYEEAIQEGYRFYSYGDAMLGV